MSPQLPYPSQRQPVLAKNVIATSQPLATSAGLRVLMDGGNAVDAALAAAITLTVVEPTSNGIGSDLFAIVWDGKKLHGLNASGRSSSKATLDVFANKLPPVVRGWQSVTVPGAVSGWVALSRKFGAIPFATLFKPAITYARDGFAVSPITAAAWANSIERLSGFAEFIRVFAPGGKSPRAGETFRSPEHAATLEEIAQSNGESFYCGNLAGRIVMASEGWFERTDFADHRPEWVETISTHYHGIDLHEIPPNGQGLAALIALGILERTDLREFSVDTAESLHLQIEAMKLAFADAYRYICDPSFADGPCSHLLSESYLKKRARRINHERAGDPKHGASKPGGTVYLTTADASGMMVSLIQSNYMGFGSGIVVPGTGIALQNRGAGFSLTPGHPNVVAPRKRPYHTIIPGFVMRDGKPEMSFGVMGGAMQPQGHVQMITRIFDHGQNVQAASDAPRWQVMGGMKVAMEEGTHLRVIEELRRRGHDIRIARFEEFGGAQLIQRMGDVYAAASDHRKDGQAAGF